MTSIRLLKNGVEAFPAMFAAIDCAVSSVVLEMYIVKDDETGREFRDRLVSAAKRDLKVMVLVDAWGSWNLPHNFWDALRNAGGTIRWFHPLLKGLFPFRNHRKLLLIDDCIAYIGGINIADEYYRGSKGERPWRDTMLELSGPETARLKRSFLRMWFRNEMPFRRLFRRLKRVRGTRAAVDGVVQFLESGPENPMRPVRRAYRQVVQNAQKNIDLAMGYFYPHGRMLRSLKRAVRRGVCVRLLVPLHTDIPITRWAARGLYGRLLRAGVEVWEYLPCMMHSKLAIADDRVIAGSANLDIRSGRFNYELVAVVHDPTLAARARADFEDDLKQSQPIRLADWNRRPFIQKIKERFSYFLLARTDVFISRLEMSRLMRRGHNRHIHTSAGTNSKGEHS
jgi:cardiolipin synthase